MLAGKHARAPVPDIKQTEPSSQSEFEQHALAQRLSISPTLSPNSAPGRKQKPPLQSESFVQPLPTSRGTMQTPLSTSQV
jgi:hypothetical protein